MSSGHDSANFDRTLYCTIECASFFASGEYGINLRKLHRSLPKRPFRAKNVLPFPPVPLSLITFLSCTLRRSMIG